MRPACTIALGFVMAAAARTAHAQPAPPIPAEPDRNTPFYNPEVPLVAPRQATSSKAKLVMVAPTVGVGELFVPDLDSGGFFLEPMLEVGNEYVSGGVGYGNLAGAHGIEFDFSALRWWQGIRLFDASGWRGTWLLPDIGLRLAAFPGQAAPPAWTLTLTTRPAGLRFARCISGSVCFQMTAATVFGPSMVEMDDLHAGVLLGGHLDIGFAFWR